MSLRLTNRCRRNAKTGNRSPGCDGGAVLVTVSAQTSRETPVRAASSAAAPSAPVMPTVGRGGGDPSQAGLDAEGGLDPTRERVGDKTSRVREPGCWQARSWVDDDGSNTVARSRARSTASTIVMM